MVLIYSKKNENSLIIDNLCSGYISNTFLNANTTPYRFFCVEFNGYGWFFYKLERFSIYRPNNKTHQKILENHNHLFFKITDINEIHFTSI